MQKGHQKRKERDQGKTGHLDGFVGGEQRWRSVGVETYKDKHQVAILPERLHYQMKKCATFLLPENSNIILIERLVGPLFLRSDLSRSSTNSLLCVIQCHENKGCPILSTRFQSYPLLLDRKTGSADLQRPTNESDLSGTNWFRWKSPCSIRGRLGKS